ncbi:hypothetical protein Tco_1043237 [Tanacetum coccineum]|uniref:Uncharacterized protein n=1 Tax=Tanacetum coccineum TaxID=301880 RepID=A0ABQ5GNI3_9ASTR
MKQPPFLVEPLPLLLAPPLEPPLLLEPPLKPPMLLEALLLAVFTQCFNIVALEVSKGANSLQAEDHNLWDVIVNGDLEEEHAPTTRETSAPPAPKTTKQLAARRNQEREAIKSRFGDNGESRKMQKNVLKHQFENFSTASNESLDKAYDRFQKLISQLEVHGAPISKEDINQKFLRSLPSSWNQIALIMRNKPDIDEIDIDDLYNNLRVYKDELKSTNEVSTASGDFGVSTTGGINHVSSTLCAQDVAYSFLAQPTTSSQLENEDF